MATIAVDFDGTIVEHRYPRIGEERPFATETLRMLINDHHRLILWTVREGHLLQEAIDWCHERGVDFWAVNRDYPEEEVEKNNHFSRKLKADYFIDDRGIGGLPDWDRYTASSLNAVHTPISCARPWDTFPRSPQGAKNGGGNDGASHRPRPPLATAQPFLNTKQ